MDWLNVAVIVVLGIFALKVIFYDFPAHMDSRGFQGYLKNVLIIVLVFGALLGVNYVFTGTWLNLDIS